MTQKLITIIILIISIILGISFLYYLIKSLLPRQKAPYISTFNRHIKILKKLKIPKGSNLIDLGCGSGKALRFFHKNYNLNDCHGVDINKYALIKGKIINYITNNSNIKLTKNNIKNTNIKQYDCPVAEITLHIYCSI